MWDCFASSETKESFKADVKLLLPALLSAGRSCWKPITMGLEKRHCRPTYTTIPLYGYFSLWKKYLLLIWTQWVSFSFVAYVRKNSWELTLWELRGTSLVHYMVVVLCSRKNISVAENKKYECQKPKVVENEGFKYLCEVYLILCTSHSNV